MTALTPTRIENRDGTRTVRLNYPDPHVIYDDFGQVRALMATGALARLTLADERAGWQLSTLVNTESAPHPPYWCWAVDEALLVLLRHLVGCPW